jgi:hypothetical protein
MVSYTLARCDDDPRSLAEARRDADFVNETGAAEDRDLACAIQSSLGSGGNEVFTFGHFESAIVHFHRQLAAALAAAA